MSLDGVSPNGPLNVDTDGDGVFDTFTPTTADPEVPDSVPPNSPSSALDTFETMAEDGNPATTAFLYELTGATTEQEMMDAINANPLAFLSAVYAWAEANGVTGTDDELIGMFLDRLRADMGFGTSNHGVPPENQILLNGADDRTNALVSGIGQMIFEQYGAEAYATYRTNIEADWADDGALSEDSRIMLDDMLSTAEANYVPAYDADGNLLSPPPETRIAQLFVKLAKDSGQIDPDKQYNDIAAQMLFQTGYELGDANDPNMPTPLGDLLAALQRMNAVNKAYDDNQRAFDAGEITEDQYLKTESLLSVQLGEARSMVSDCAIAAGVDPNEMLRKAIAEGFVLALTDPVTAAEVEALWLKRQERAALGSEVRDMIGSGMDINSPEVRGRLNRIDELDTEIAGLETTLNGKDITTTDAPHAGPGESFDDLYHGIFRVREGALDQALVAETNAAVQGVPPTYADLIGQIEKLAALRAELAQVDADEAAGTITPGLAATKRTNLMEDALALEAELVALAEANELAPDTFTDPGKSLGYVAALKNDDLGPLFADWRNKTGELAAADARVVELEAAGVDPEGTSPESIELAAKRGDVLRLRDEIFKIESEIRFKMHGGDPSVIPELDKKRAERDTAYQAWQARLQQVHDSGSFNPDDVMPFYEPYAALDAEVKALEARLLPTGEQWNGDIAWAADGAIAAHHTGADVGWRIETDTAYATGYSALDDLTNDQMKQLLAYQDALNKAYEDGTLSEEERVALVPLFHEVVAFMPPQFFDPGDTTLWHPADPAFDPILAKSRDILNGTFAEGMAQRASEIAIENETLLMDADVATVLATLFDAAGGQLTGETASAHLAYVLQMLGISVTPEELDTFLEGGALPPAKEKAMLVAAQFFAQSQGLTVDDAAALNILRNALKGDLGRAESPHRVDRWEQVTYAGTDDINGVATPQTELLRSLMSVLHEIYFEVYGEKAAAELDKGVRSPMYDGITAVYREDRVATWTGAKTEQVLEYNEVSRDLWNPETGQVTGFQDNQFIDMEWKFTVVLTKDHAYKDGTGTSYVDEYTEYVDPNDQARIAELKDDGYVIARVEATETPEPQRMMARLLAGLDEYMKNYKPVYDAEGNLTNPPPLARIAQYYVQTQFAADVKTNDFATPDVPDPEGQIGWKNYRIDETGVHMSDKEAIERMFTELEIPPGDIEALFDPSLNQWGESQTLYDGQTMAGKIVGTILDEVLTFGLIGLFTGIIDKNSRDDYTKFSIAEMKAKNRDTWRAENRDDMNDISGLDIAISVLLIGVPEVAGGFFFSAGRAAKKGADVADSATDGTRRGRTIWDKIRGRDGNTSEPGAVFESGPGPSGGSYTLPDSPRSGDLDPLLPVPPLPHGLQAPEIELVDLAPLAPPLTDNGTPLNIPTTNNIYKWEDAVTFEALSPDVKPTKTPIPEIFTTKDGNGKPANYALMKGPNGTDVYVRVDYYMLSPGVPEIPEVPGTAAVPGTPAVPAKPAVPAVPADPNAIPPVVGSAAIPAVAAVPAVPGTPEVPRTPSVPAQPAQYEWRIYSPSEGATSVRTMPMIEWNATKKIWEMKGTTPVSSGDYQKLIDSGTFVSNGRQDGGGVLPGMATKDLVRGMRTGAGNTDTVLSGPMDFTVEDPMDLLTENGLKFVRGDETRKDGLVNAFKVAKEQNEGLQIQLQTYKEDKAFFESALSKLEAYQATYKKDGKEMTWADLKKDDPGLADALEKAGLTRRTSEGLLPETSLDTVIAGARRELRAANDNILATQGKITDNTKNLDALINAANNEGHGEITRSGLFTARNGSIATAFSVVVVTFASLLNYFLNKKDDPAPDQIDISENVVLAPEGKETIDVAGLSGTEGKGYTYVLSSGYLDGKGVTINKETGEVTVTSGPDSTFQPGDEVTFSVMIKDKDGKIVGKVTIAVAVDGEPAEKAA